jgi:phosphotransacetylase
MFSRTAPWCPSPSDTLADIAIASAEKARNLLQEEPRVACFPFPPRAAPIIPGPNWCAQAVEQIRERAPDLKVDGEIAVRRGLGARRWRR